MKNKRLKKKSSANLKRKSYEIKDYDTAETGEFINQTSPLHFEDLGLQLPKTSPTQVVSIRLPSELLNELRAIGSAKDIGYQALVKLFLADAVREFKKKNRAA